MKLRNVFYRLLPERLLLPVILYQHGRWSELVNGRGFARTFRLMRPVDENDQPLPWLPYCAIELLDERIGGVQSLLEFGAGHSTLYFAKRVPCVTSVEHDAKWVQTVSSQTNGNSKILQVSVESAESYTAPVRNGTELFDLILVDGAHRVECFRLALEHLTRGGVIVLDDSERVAYADIFPLATQAGFRTLHLRGHKPDSVELHRTSFFYRDGNCLGI